jgi:hypothetical protein
MSSLVIGRTSANGLDGIRFVGAQPAAYACANG